MDYQVKNMIDRKEIERKLRELHIHTYVIHNDGTVDVMENVNIYQIFDLSEIPIKFGKVYGNFIMTGHVGLTSLKNAPDYVRGSFSCSNCSITSLEGVPEYIGDYFSCEFNKITSLEYFPKYIGGNIYLHANRFSEDEHYFNTLLSLTNGNYKYTTIQSVLYMIDDSYLFKQWLRVKRRQDTIDAIINS